MLLSCLWLSELLGRTIDVSPDADSTTPFTAAHIAAKLTSLGLEVDGIDYCDLSGVIAGRIEEVSPHANASKLSVVQLFDGKQTTQVVCGASNLPAPGGMVAFAPVGVVLPDGLELSQRELRGVTSNGMICSESELEIGPDGDGILVLPTSFEPGKELRELVPGIRDAVIEISVTPNRPDALGHLGVARDLALALGCEVQLPATEALDAAPEQPELVELVAKDRCPRYLGFALEDCTVGPAPLWMRVRLHRVGMRARNNVVDVTNFVLMESGQPMHAFDRANLAQERVVVRLASPGEPMTLLDETKLELREDDLVIADADRPQALAGVMGGEHSMVEAKTERLLLEVAFFSPSPIRRSARRYGLHTDSSHRFERCVDSEAQLEFAAGRALKLLRDCAGVRCVGRIDARGELPARPSIALDPAHVGRLLGMDIDADEVGRILAGLEIAIERSSDSLWQCTPPSYRPDLTRAVDLVEEVMRHHGLDHLPVRHSVSSAELAPIPEDPRRRMVESLRDGLREQGLHEHLGLAFIGIDQVEALGAILDSARLVRPLNPMVTQQGCMRPHLLPGLLEAVAHNHGRHGRPLALFELGRIYRWPASPPAADIPATAEVDRLLPEEPERAAALRACRDKSLTGALAHSLTHDLLACLTRSGLHAQLRAPAQLEPWLHPGIQIGLWIGEQQVGVVGELHPDLIAKRDLGDLELAYGELWIEALPALPVVQFEPMTRFPATARDLSLDLSDSIQAHLVLDALRSSARTAQSAIQSEDPVELASADEPRHPISIREDYRGEGVSEGRHALLLRLSYRAHGRSVKDAEVQPLHDAIVSAALEQVRAHDPDARVR